MTATIFNRKNYFRYTGLLKYLICFYLLQSNAYAQPALVKADSSWGKEVFNFPLSFAPEIKYSGTEEAWFPKGWAHKDSASFWSYAFAWKIETKAALTPTDLENDLQYYFDGLMSDRLGLSKEKVPATIALLIQTASPENSSYFTGKVQIYDAFTLKKNLVLHVTVEQLFCKQRLHSILLFRFSPKETGHAIWEKLNKLTIHQESKSLCIDR